MTILTADADLSTDLLFLTANVDPFVVYEKLSVVSLTGSMTQIYLNGDKLKVSRNIVYALRKAMSLLAGLIKGHRCTIF